MAKKKTLSKARRIGKAPKRGAQSIGRKPAQAAVAINDGPVITSVVARAVTAPLARPLFVATGAVEHAALVLIDITTNEPLRYNKQNLLNPHFLVSN